MLKGSFNQVVQENQILKVKVLNLSVLYYDVFIERESEVWKDHRTNVIEGLESDIEWNREWS